MRMTNENLTVQDTWVEGNEGRLFVRVWSPEAATSRSPIILFHDSLGSVELWRGFPAALVDATARQVVAYDRLGFGKSDEHTGKLGLDFIGNEAERGFAAIKQQMGIKRFILFGHSVGGGMAINCAARFSDACIALIAESAQAFVEDRTVQGIEEAKELFKDENQVNRLRKYHGEKARWVLDAWIGSWLHPGFSTWSLTSVLPNVKCPVLVIHGVDDEYGSAKHPELITELTGGRSHLEIMADTRHVPHREKESAVIQILANFVAPLA